jgi:hypothetical protein
MGKCRGRGRGWGWERLFSDLHGSSLDGFGILGPCLMCQALYKIRGDPTNTTDRNVFVNCLKRPHSFQETPLLGPGILSFSLYYTRNNCMVQILPTWWPLVCFSEREVVWTIQGHLKWYGNFGRTYFLLDQSS